MSMQAWILLWKIVLIGGISLFAVLAIVVIVGGFLDTRRLLRRLREQHAQHEQHAREKGAVRR